jgi:hypothetical protein
MSSIKAKQYLEKEIQERIRAVSSQHFDHEMNLLYNKDDYEYNNGEMEAWIYLTLKRIYILICAYLEVAGYPGLLQIFKDRYESKIDDQNFMLHTSADSFDASDVDPLSRVQEFSDFLMPFESFAIFKEHNDALNRLEQILSETDQILLHNNISPENEKQVYDEVKWILQFLYPSIRNKHNARIIEKFKTYSPDILLPEVSAAVEYKFIREKENPGLFIEQVYIDAGVYHKDHEYSNFYAVLYLHNNKKYTKQSIKQAWMEKNFPPNWKMIICGR